MHLNNIQNLSNDEKKHEICDETSLLSSNNIDLKDKLLPARNSSQINNDDFYIKMQNCIYWKK